MDYTNGGFLLGLMNLQKKILLGFCMHAFVSASWCQLSQSHTDIREPDVLTTMDDTWYDTHLPSALVHALLDAVDQGNRAGVESVLAECVDKHSGEVRVSELAQIALNDAVWGGQVDIAGVLMQYGANVNVVNGGETLLAAVAKGRMARIGSPRHVRELEDPQELAAEDELHVRMARLLLAHGAVVEAKTYEINYWTDEAEFCACGTAYDIAEENGNLRLMIVLRAWARWHRLVPKARFAGRVAATLIRMVKEAAERAYSPGGIGFEAASESFQSLAINQQRES